MFVCICAWIVISQTRVQTDLSTFMPRPVNPQQRFVIHQLREGPATRLILVGVEGDEQRNLAGISRELGHTLRTSRLFARIENGEVTTAAADLDKLFAYRYLLAPEVTRRLDADGLESALQRRLQELSSPLAPLVTHNLRSDPTAELERVAASWRGDFAARLLDGVWFAADAQRALLLAYMAAPGFDVDAQARAIELIRGSFAQAAANTQAQLLMSGPGVFAVASRDSMRDEARTLSTIASLFLAALLLIIYRSPRAVLIAALPLATGMLAGTAVTTLAFGTLHGITLGFGITLLGVAIDYPLHIFSHLKSSESVHNTLQGIWPTLRLGVLTTACGYLGMSLTSFEGIAQLGVFAAGGLLAAAAFCRWVMPMLTPQHEVFDPTGARWMNVLLAPPQAARWSLLCVAAVAGVFLLGTGRVLWETDVAALSPVPAQARQLDGDLRAGLGAPDVRHAVLIRAQDAETALQRSESVAPELKALVAEGVISGFDTVTRYLPSAATQRARQLRLPDRETVARDLARASQGLGFKSGTFEPFLQALAAARELEPLTPEELGDSPLGFRIASLLSRDDETWVSLITLRDVTDAGRLANRLSQHRGQGIFHIDAKALSNDMVNAYRDEALQRLAWAAALILLGLAVLLRDWRRTRAVCLSLLVALVLTLALLVLRGEKMSLFHLISLILIAGIGIDYGLFFSLPGHDLEDRKRTLHALTVCAISTATVFGTIATSEIPVLATIGATVAIGVIANFIAAIVLAQPHRIKQVTNSARGV
ncbi:MAG: MMPL family transporter [Gammaproteobacteria bacterium]